MSTPDVILLIFVVSAFVLKGIRTAFFLSCLLVTLSARADVRAELDALLAEDPVTVGSVSRIRELGDATSRQNLQQLCYKTACAGFAALGDTSRYEETLTHVITKTFVESFHAKCSRCRGLGVAMRTCPDCGGKRCPACAESGSVKGRCPDCDGKAAVFSPELALATYRRGLAALAKATDPQNPQASPLPKPAAPSRLTEDQFFARHCLDLAAYAVFTNRQSTTIQRNEAFSKIAARAYVPRGFSNAILLYRYPNGESFEVADVSTSEDVFHVRLRKPGDVWTKTLVIPRSESDVAFWKKGRPVTSRDWVFAAPAYHPSVPSSQGFFSMATSTLFRSLAEFRRLHPGAEDTETP